MGMGGVVDYKARSVEHPDHATAVSGNGAAPAGLITGSSRALQTCVAIEAHRKEIETPQRLK